MDDFGFVREKGMQKKGKLSILGLCMGMVNGLFGAGGGSVAIPSLLKLDEEQHVAQASVLAALLPLSLCSAVGYVWRSGLPSGVGFVVLGAFPGGLLGAKLMGRLNAVWLSRLLSAFMLTSGVLLIMT